MHTIVNVCVCVCMSVSARGVTLAFVGDRNGRPARVGVNTVLSSGRAVMNDNPRTMIDYPPAGVVWDGGGRRGPGVPRGGRREFARRA